MKSVLGPRIVINAQIANGAGYVHLVVSQERNVNIVAYVRENQAIVLNVAATIYDQQFIFN